MLLSADVIKKLKDDSAFNAYRAYVMSKISELNTLDGLEDLPNEEAGEQAKVRSYAVKLLKDILTPVIYFKEKTEPTDEDIKIMKNRYGMS